MTQAQAQGAAQGAPKKPQLTLSTKNAISNMEPVQ
jgi:hypothetical protein